jgi:hypothetical protein
MIGICIKNMMNFPETLKCSCIGVGVYFGLLITESSCSNGTHKSGMPQDTVFKFEQSKGFTKENLVLLDSLKMYGDINAYVFAFNAGTLGYSSSFLSFAPNSKSISYDNAYLRTNSYCTMAALPDSTLLLKTYDNDTTQLLKGNMKIKIELTSQGNVIPERKRLRIFPYKLDVKK